jgi:NDP-sugar pyrophosphorylase family protein
MDNLSPDAFFDLTEGPVAGLFRDITYVWDAVALLPEYIEKIIRPEILGEVEEGAWVEPGLVQLGEGSRVERGAIVRGPTIIGCNTVVRSAAYIRGHVWLGDDCMVGHGVELRQLLLLNKSSIPHLNCVFTSLIGNRTRLGGCVHTANFRLDAKEIDIRIDVQGEKQSFQTGQKLFGTVVGDDSVVGGNTLLYPGTIIGRNCLVMPQCTVSGYISPDSMVKPKTVTFEVVPR